MTSITDQEHDYQIISDGRTVWINDMERCIGRLCKFSGELFLTNTRIKGDFDLFVSEVKQRYGIIIKEHHRPLWSNP
jgi:hypothetical protein